MPKATVDIHRVADSIESIARELNAVVQTLRKSGATKLTLKLPRPQPRPIPWVSLDCHPRATRAVERKTAAVSSSTSRAALDVEGLKSRLAVIGADLDELRKGFKQLGKIAE